VPTILLKPTVHRVGSHGPSPLHRRRSARASS
jgi:hypothetical protein